MSKHARIRRTKQLTNFVAELEQQRTRLKAKVITAFVAGAVFGFVFYHFLTLLTP